VDKKSLPKLEQIAGPIVNLRSEVIPKTFIILSMDELIVIGASVRALAFSAIRAGYKPYAVDLFADRDLAAACPAAKIGRYPQDFEAALSAAPQAPWMYAGALENYPELIEQLAKIRPLIGNGADVVRRVRDVAQLGEAAKAAGCLVPEVRDSAAEGKWLVKPWRSSGGLGVRLAAQEEMREAPRGSYLQRYVEGEALSAVFLAAGGKAVLVGVTKQLMGRDFGLASEFLYVGNVGPITLGGDQIARLKKLGEALAAEFKLKGLFNVDFVFDGNDFWLLEVNPRYSASVEVLERGREVQAVGLHVAACGGGTVKWLARNNPDCFGKAVVYAERDCRVMPVLEMVAGELNDPRAWPAMADLPRTGEEICAGQPVVTVFAGGEGKSIEEVDGELRQRVKTAKQMVGC
jgi:predicted ATP-grasp superfamily ATP-dependent carboligase